MDEGTQQAALAVHVQIARSPDGGRAYIASKDCIVRSKLINNFSYELRVYRRAARLARCQLIQPFASLFVVLKASVKISAVGLLVQHRSERIQSVLHVAYQSKVDRSTPPDLLATQVNLKNLCLLRKELRIRKIRAEHQQRIAVHHRVVTGGEAEQASHAYVIWIVVLDELLTTQRVHNGSLKSGGQRDQSVMRSLATSAAENRDFLSAVEQLCRLAEFLIGWTNH